MDGKIKSHMGQPGGGAPLLVREAESAVRGLLVLLQTPMKCAGSLWDADSAGLSKVNHQDGLSNVQQQHRKLRSCVGQDPPATLLSQWL